MGVRKSHLVTESVPWPIRLFRRSVLKQQKFAAITELLGPTKGLRCLDIGGDNGVISYLLRERGGIWTSADMGKVSVSAIRRMVGERVYRIDGGRLPFDKDQFDRAVIVDLLEHLHDDEFFLREMHRVLKPGGELIINVPALSDGLIRKLRLMLGQTDQAHGHVRPGYTLGSLKQLLEGAFELEQSLRYSGFFSQLIDMLIVFAASVLKGTRGKPSDKGLVITDQDLEEYRKYFLVYSIIYPFVWLISQLDRLFSLSEGHMLITRAKAKERIPNDKEKVG